MRASIVRLPVFSVLMAAVYAPAVFADTVFLQDGSQLRATVQTLSADKLKLQTGFAGVLEIDRKLVKGIDTDEPVKLALVGGRVVDARLVYAAADDQQRYRADQESASVSRPDAPLGGIAEIAPQQIVADRDAAEAARHKLPEASIAPPADGEYWSGALSLGINGNSGNTDNRSVRLSGSALRDTGPTRLSFSGAVDREREDGDQTSDEYRASSRYENDFTDRAFWFAQQKLKKDRFQNLKIRSRTTVGPGYFLARQDDLIFKVRSGIGYQYEDYTDDQGSNGTTVFEAGWDYAQLFGDWLKLTHEFSIYPEITNAPSDNFTLESVLGAQIPLASSRDWSIRLSLENDYNNQPQPGVEKTDTSYNVGITRQF